MEYSEHVIQTLDEFFTVAGFEIYSDEGEEIHLKVKSTNKIIKVRRDLFTKYSTPDSSRIEEEDHEYSINVKTESNLPGSLTKIKFAKQLSPREIKGDFDQASLIKTNATGSGKASEVQGTNIHSPIKNESPKGVDKAEEDKEDGNFANIFNGLEEMSNNSTLFDDFDDDDAPPPLPGTKNLVKKNTEKSKNLEERGQDSSAHRSVGATPDSMRDLRDKNNPNFGENDLFATKKLSEIPKTMKKEEDFDFIEKRMTMKITNPEKFFDPMIVIAQLKEELRLKNEELQRMNMKFNTFGGRLDHSDLNFTTNDIQNSSSYHLAFLFASPLVRKMNSNIEMIMQLDYQNEIIGIEKHLNDVKHEINYKINVATQSNFRSVIVDAPFALHFTGHGIPNDKKALGPAYMQYKDKGNILLLEDE